MGWPIMPKDAVHCVVLYEKARQLAPDFQVEAARGLARNLVVWEAHLDGHHYGTAVVAPFGWATMRALLSEAVDQLEKVRADAQLDRAAACVPPHPRTPERCSPIVYGPDDVLARYHRDPVFRSVVEQLHAALHQYAYTPTELREAVVLACTQHAYKCHRYEIRQTFRERG